METCTEAFALLSQAEAFALLSQAWWHFPSEDKHRGFCIVETCREDLCCGDLQRGICIVETAERHLHCGDLQRGICIVVTSREAFALWRHA